MKIDRKKQLEVLGNDTLILDTLFKNKDGEELVYPGKYMPNGQDFRISLKGVDRMTAELRERMVSLVRSQFNARENEQNAEKVRKKDAPSSGDERGRAHASDRGRGTEPATRSREERETSLEEVLRTRETRYTEELERLDYELGQVVDDRNLVIKQLQEVRQCIKALQDVSPTTSDASDTPKEPRPQKSGSTSGGPKGSKRKTTKRSQPNSKKESSNV